ncbi:MAG: hypothetical protein ACI4JA_05510 [Oscillospiraceae bacterium]
MLKNLLSPDECAKCKLCCSFDSYDLWETPVITRDKANQILQDFKPDQEFVKRDEHFLLKMKKEPEVDLYYCSLLDSDNGCILGSEKPFDCKIWPFRIMNFNGTKVITLSPVCPVVNSRKMEDIKKTCEEISEEIFAEAEKHPEYVKPYLKGYPILAVEEKGFSKTLV